MRPDGPRPTIVGNPDGPEPPYPLKLDGKVIKGFGRGSKDVSEEQIVLLYTLNLLYIADSAFEPSLSRCLRTLHFTSVITLPNENWA